MNVVFKLKCITVFDHYCFNCSQEATENMVHRLSSLEHLQVNMTCSYVYGSWECVDCLQNLQLLFFKVACVMEIKCSMCFQEGIFWLSILLCYFYVIFVSFLVSSSLLGQTNQPSVWLRSVEALLCFAKYCSGVWFFLFSKSSCFGLFTS